MDGTGYGPAPVTDELIRSLFDQHLELIKKLAQVCENQQIQIDMLLKFVYGSTK